MSPAHPLRRIVPALLVALAVAAGGCRSEDDPAGPAGEEADDMTDADADSPAEEVRHRAAASRGAEPDRIQLDGPVAIGRPGCALYAAWDLDSTNPHPNQYAVLADGSVVEGLAEEDAARRALDDCFVDAGREPTAEEVAEVVVRLADAPGPVGLLDPEVGSRRLAPLGLDYRPPSVTGSVADGDYAVSYFARDLETGELLEATVTRAPDGALEVDYRPL